MLSTCKLVPCAQSDVVKIWNFFFACLRVLPSCCSNVASFQAFPFDWVVVCVTSVVVIGSYCVYAPLPLKSSPTVLYHSLPWNCNTNTQTSVVITSINSHNPSKESHQLKKNQKIFFHLNHVSTCKLLPFSSSKRSRSWNSLRTCILLHRLRTSVRSNMAKGNERRQGTIPQVTWTN